MGWHVSLIERDAIYWSGVLYRRRPSYSSVALVLLYCEPAVVYKARLSALAVSSLGARSPGVSPWKRAEKKRNEKERNTESIFVFSKQMGRRTDLGACVTSATSLNQRASAAVGVTCSLRAKVQWRAADRVGDIMAAGVGWSEPLAGLAAKCTDSRRTDQ